MEFEYFEQPDHVAEDDYYEIEPVYAGTQERHVPYPDRCENLVKIPEDEQYDDSGHLGPCGGFLWDVGGTGYYNGQYQCYTLYLECENCGEYEVECV